MRYATAVLINLFPILSLLAADIKWTDSFSFDSEPAEVAYTAISEKGRGERMAIPKGAVSGSECCKRRPIIVFDFGGVIGGTDRALVANSLASVLDLSLPEAHTLMADLQAARQKGVSQDQFWGKYEEVSGKALPVNWTDTYDEMRMEAIRANPEMLYCVESLREHGYRVAMLSNTTPSRASFIRSHGFYRYFEPVVLSCEIGVKKPHRAAFVCLLDQLGVEAEDCIMIDDKPENIEAARHLGLDGILFTSFDDFMEQLKKRGIRVSCLNR